MTLRALTLIAAACLFATPAAAAEAIDGAKLSWLWALPFAGILLSIATGPVLYPHVWEHHYG
ncbi:sodium:proton antiporter, partial [Acinetobacter pittii]|uniref:sodium:proton antiporter n=1 Tax=Acinetobacter pittii TaxID=48296 RepID=UPI00148F498A